MGVLQGSGLSPTLFMIYFMRGCQSLRTCDKCVEEMNLSPKERKSFCRECGKAVVYADDLTALHKGEGSREDIKRKVELQGEKVDISLKKLGLAMNKSKTQFITAMNYQRKKPSHISKDSDRRFGLQCCGEIWTFTRTIKEEDQGNEWADSW